MAKAKKKAEPKIKKAAPKKRLKPVVGAVAAAELEPAPLIGGELERKVLELVDLNGERKALERDEAVLKDWFKERAGDHDLTFTASNGASVQVSHEEREAWDEAELARVLTAEMRAQCRKKLPFVKVTVRAAQEKAA